MDKFPRKRSAFKVWIEGRNKELQNFLANRKINYPEIGEQLDAIWHDIDTGVLPGKEGKFYKLLAANKQRFKAPQWDVDEFIRYDFSKHEFDEDLD
tara:strand:+ start:424 stop:711 length:288 start_codon:yes stop_codon:yes gene_type:complete